jgi:putative PIN family toxin of toxin-antitoxin system
MPGQVVNAALDGRFMPVTSDAILAELGRVLRYEHLSARFPEPDRIVALWADACVIVSPTVTYELAAGDNHLLEAAQESEADCIVTGDKPLLAVGDDHGFVRLGTVRTSILTVRSFLELLARSS